MAVDEMIREIEEQYEVLSSFVPDSRLHEIINNPIDEGIDEGYPFIVHLLRIEGGFAPLQCY